MEDTKVLTPEEQAKLDKNAKRAQELADIRNSVREYKDEIVKVLTNTEIPEEVVANLAYIIGNKRSKKARVLKGRAPALKDVVREKFAEVGSVIDELTLFLTLHIGRPEMQFRVNQLIKTTEPENRPWIQFVEPVEGEDMGSWQLVHVGEDAPEGWEGYLPPAPKNEDGNDY
jgi:hypothetical protein